MGAISNYHDLDIEFPNRDVSIPKRRQPSSTYRNNQDSVISARKNSSISPRKDSSLTPRTRHHGSSSYRNNQEDGSPRSSRKNLKKADTAPPEIEPLTPEEIEKVEQEVILALSLVRRYPLKVVKILEKQLSRFNGNDFYLGPGQILVTREGKRAVKDAIKFLKEQEPISKLSSKNVLGMKLAAEDHVFDNGTTGSQEHEGSDGSKPYERIERYGTWEKNCGECLWYGESKKGLEMVIDLIVDDGVPDRSHRHCIFTPCYKMVGVKIGQHRSMGMMLCIDFAAGFESIKENIHVRLHKGPPPVDTSKIQKLKAPKCSHCKHPIVGAVLKAPQGQFHLKCFNCDTCEANLNGVPFGIVNGLTMCKSCVKNSRG